MKPIKVGVCGAGSFAGHFIPLFQAHPDVRNVVFAEAMPDRRREQATRFGITETYGSLEELCRSDVDAVAIFTQRWLHGPMALAALRAGKHVYSAVPAAVTLEELAELVAVVKETGLTYALGETSYYYPQTLLCRERYAKGEMGAFVYGESEYLHDMSHGFYEAYQNSSGADWKRTASFPPMLYPTHTVSMIVSVTGARMTDVSCFGYVDRSDDGVFRSDVSLWNNTLSNETALFRMSDGSVARINEFRRVGVSGGRSVRCSLYGTEASFEEQAGGAVWTRRVGPVEDVEPLLACAPHKEPDDAARVYGLPGEIESGYARVHPAERLPKEFAGLGNGHFGSHQFLVDDFVRACVRGKLPPNHVWAAARYNAPGIVAHKSALRDGERMVVPDFGDPPAGSSVLWE